MGSLCNSIVCATTVVPAINSAFHVAILSTPSLILPTLPRLFRTKCNVSPRKASAPKTYVYPDPIPEFAAAETQKFKVELLKKLSKEKDTFGNDLQRVVNVCAEIFSEYLHDEYGGPGTLLIEPFTDIMVALKEENLPGAVSAARASLLWAQNYVDRDWEDWNSKLH